MFVPSVKLTDAQVAEVSAYDGQIIFEKQDNDVRMNRNVGRFMERVKPSVAVVYGVVSEICVDKAVEFIAGDLGIKTYVVSDAVKELDKPKADFCWSDWRQHDVKEITTAEVDSLI